MDNYKKYKLGRRAFTIFFLGRIKTPLAFFVLSGIIWYFRDAVPLEYQYLMEYAWEIVLLIAVALLLFVLARTYLEYRRYTYGFSDEAFIVTYGYVVRNEIAAVYHQIHSVNIKRTYAERIIGVSQLIILMAGADRDPHHNQIVLPGLGHKRAKVIQHELLVRARRHSIPQHAPTPESV